MAKLNNSNKSKQGTLFRGVGELKTPKMSPMDRYKKMKKTLTNYVKQCHFPRSTKKIQEEMRIVSESKKRLYNGGLENFKLTNEAFNHRVGVDILKDKEKALIKELKMNAFLHEISRIERGGLCAKEEESLTQCEEMGLKIIFLSDELARIKKGMRKLNKENENKTNEVLQRKDDYDPRLIAMTKTLQEKFKVNPEHITCLGIKLGQDGTSSQTYYRLDFKYDLENKTSVDIDATEDANNKYKDIKIFISNSYGNATYVVVDKEMENIISKQEIKSKGGVIIKAPDKVEIDHKITESERISELEKYYKYRIKKILNQK